MKGKVFLIPMLIANPPVREVLPLSIKDAVKGIYFFLCENVRTARRYVSSLKIHDSIEALDFKILDKDTGDEAIQELLSPIGEGHHVGILSESGCPGIADPGALAVRFAHDHNITVIPLVGPSSILLALMASGLNGQQFAFHGYLPIDANEAFAAIRKLELESKQKNQTQIFIETPYRNNLLLSRLTENLHPDSRLCVAVDLTGENEMVICRSVRGWKREPIQLPKVPAVYLFLAPPQIR